MYNNIIVNIDIIVDYGESETNSNNSSKLRPRIISIHSSCPALPPPQTMGRLITRCKALLTQSAGY